MTEADVTSSNLVLFGTKTSNLLIARFAARLPLDLSLSAADYGLAFIAPVGKHTVLVNSGLPWWTGAPAKRVLPAFAPTVYGLLETFPDFILFKGSLENIVAQGRFDNHWKLAPADREKLEASGVVRIR